MFWVILTKTEKSGYFWFNWIIFFETRICCMSWVGYEETILATVLHFTPRQGNIISMTSWKMPQNPMTSGSELPTRALALVGHLPFQISHSIVFISTCILVRPTATIFGSGNMVTAITVLPRVRKWKSALILLSWHWGIYFSPNENGEISRAIYLILSLRIIFKNKFALMRKRMLLKGIFKDIYQSCIPWSQTDFQ